MDFVAEDKRRRDKRINFWLTEQEHTDIEKRAQEYNMSISEYIRTLALNADIEMSLNHIKSSKEEVVKEEKEAPSDDELVNLIANFLEEAAIE